MERRWDSTTAGAATVSACGNSSHPFVMPESSHRWPGSRSQRAGESIADHRLSAEEVRSPPGLADARVIPPCH